MIAGKLTARHEIQVAAFSAWIEVAVPVHIEAGRACTTHNKIEFHIVSRRHDCLPLVGLYGRDLSASRLGRWIVGGSLCIELGVRRTAAVVRVRSMVTDTGVADCLVHNQPADV